MILELVERQLDEEEVQYNGVSISLGAQLSWTHLGMTYRDVLFFRPECRPSLFNPLHIRSLAHSKKSHLISVALDELVWRHHPKTVANHRAISGVPMLRT